MDGYFVELNDGLEPAPRLHASRRCGRPHSSSASTPRTASAPKPRPAALFEGGETLGFENRYRAKDGSWHWLRWSSQLSPGRVDDLRPRHRRHRAEADRGRTRGAAGSGRRTWPGSDSLTGSAEPARPRGAAAAGDGPGPPQPSRRSAWRSSTSTTSRLQRHPRPPRRRRGAARLRHAPGTARCAARTRSSASAARSSSSSCRTRAPEQAAEIVERLRAADPDGPDLLGRSRLLGLRREHRRPAAAGPTGPLPGQGQRPRPAGAGELLAVATES